MLARSRRDLPDGALGEYKQDLKLCQVGRRRETVKTAEIFRNHATRAERRRVSDRDIL